MTTEKNIPSLKNLEYIPYIDENGELPEQYQGKIGVYGIFDQEKLLQFVGYSRNVFLSQTTFSATTAILLLGQNRNY